MSDKHVAHHNLHLVPAGTLPGSSEGGTLTQLTQIVPIDVHNPFPTVEEFDLVLETDGFEGEVALALPHRIDARGKHEGFTIVPREDLVGEIRETLEHWHTARDRLLAEPPPRLNGAP